MRRYDDDFDDDDEDDDDYDDRPRRRKRNRNRDVGRHDSQRLAAGLCALLCGGFGVHKFILGYHTEGVILLTITLSGLMLGTIGVFGGAICCVPIVLVVFYATPMVSGIIALVEGIIYLTKTDEEFYQMYQVRRKPWF